MNEHENFATLMALKLAVTTIATRLGEIHPGFADEVAADLAGAAEMVSAEDLQRALHELSEMLLAE